MPKLLDSVRSACRRLGYSRNTEKSYTHRIRRYIRFHDKKHPKLLSELEIGLFLAHLADDRNVAPSTQNRALNAIVFLYRHVLDSDVGGLVFRRAKRPQRLPVVLTPDEVRCLLSCICGTPRLVASLLYGSGLRLGEAISLRVKDVDIGIVLCAAADTQADTPLLRLAGCRAGGVHLPVSASAPWARHAREVRALLPGLCPPVPAAGLI